MSGRVPKMDEITLEILSEEAIIVYLQYLDKLKQLFTQYNHINFNAGKKVTFLFRESFRSLNGEKSRRRTRR